MSSEQPGIVQGLETVSSEEFPFTKGTFRKLGYLILGVLYNKDPTIYGTILGSPIFGNPQSSN